MRSRLQVDLGADRQRHAVPELQSDWDEHERWHLYRCELERRQELPHLGMDEIPEVAGRA